MEYDGVNKTLGSKLTEVFKTIGSSSVMVIWGTVT